jgi:hypothetical protein
VKSSRLRAERLSTWRRWEAGKLEGEKIEVERLGR